MFFVKKSELLNNFNNKILQKEIIEYTKKNKCCNNDDCVHPKMQSNPTLHNHFKIFQKSITEELNLKINKLWCFYVKQKNKTLETWHTHDNQISCLMYLSENKLGTKFENFYIKLNINCWLVWKGNLLHTPEPGLVKKDRIIIAGTLFE